MPYPFIFKPNTACLAADIYASSQSDCRIQLFKPLLGCTFNSSIAPPAYLLPSGGLILRGLLEYDRDQVQMQDCGPDFWYTGLSPTFYLNEDPAFGGWRIVDGLPWLVEDEIHLLSFFASKTATLPNPQGGAGLDVFNADTLTSVWLTPHSPSSLPADFADLQCQRVFKNTSWEQAVTSQNCNIWFRLSYDNYYGVMGAPPLRNAVFSWADAVTGMTWYYLTAWWDFIEDVPTPYVACLVSQCSDNRAQPPAYR